MIEQKDLEAFKEEHPALVSLVESDSATLRPDPQKQLFHYTTAEGLLGIIRTNSLWATNLKFLNDFSELEYGTELFREMLKEKKAHTQCSSTECKFLEELEEASMPFELLRIFALSLSEAPNQLSQWRAYGGNSTGYSIGFNSSFVQKLRYADSGVPFLFKVCYDRKMQRDLLMNLISTFSSAVRESSKHKTSLFSSSLLAQLPFYFVPFKNGAFQEEREWRLVCMVNYLADQKHLEFRTSGGFISPYYLLKPPGNNLLPVEVVYQGPRVSPEIGAEAVRGLLRKHGHKDFEVKDSGIPLRNP